MTFKEQKRRTTPRGYFRWCHNLVSVGYFILRKHISRLFATLVKIFSESRWKKAPQTNASKEAWTKQARAKNREATDISTPKAKPHLSSHCSLVHRRLCIAIAYSSAFDRWGKNERANERVHINKISYNFIYKKIFLCNRIGSHQNGFQLWGKITKITNR